MIELDVDKLDFTKSNGLVTVVAQHAVTGVVLMIAHADREAVEKTISTGEMHYTSRTRGLWHKGATSGNTQRVVSLSADCDSDAILARVIPKGPSCHTLSESCFGEAALGGDALSVLDQTVVERAKSLDDGKSSTSYTRKLLGDRNLRLKKIGEESAELLAALADADDERMADEAADLFYHVLVALRANGIGLDDVRTVLAKRAEQR
ncbi:MAG: bifunctional phosphoribosyl-AMP cyclohydrolase/phosphoribosyl-ATP diphosphatase HisIE [Thermoanaerobaculia bacterium]